MPLELYPRGTIWWFKGRIDRIPGGEYHRRSTGSSDKGAAQEVLAAFEARQLKGHFAGSDASLTFAEAILLYKPTPEMARALQRLLPHLGERACSSITPQEIRDLGAKILPDSATDTWRRWVVAPVRAVINNAHDLGRCPPIKIRAFSSIERQRQDRARGKASRVKKTPGSWEWIMAFRAHANPYLAAMALFMFETAARIGQATSLEPDDLDLQNFRVWMPEAKGMDACWVTISAELVAELANLKPRQPRAQRAGMARPSARVFGYASKDGVYGAWRTACKNADIEPIMPHAAGRHGFATELIVRQGLKESDVASEGRWSDVHNMLRTYAHTEDAERKVQDALAAGRKKATGGKRKRG